MAIITPRGEASHLIKWNASGIVPSPNNFFPRPSVIGNILLERIVIGKNIILPNEILKNLHEELVRVFSAGMVESDDGMEICLIQFDELKNEITVSQTSQSAIIIYPDSLIKELERRVQSYW